MRAALLQRLFEIEPVRFRDEYWRRSWCVAHGPIERIADLTAVPALQDVASLLAAHPGPCWILQQTPRGGADHEQRVSTGEAPAWLARGASIDLRDLQQWLPVAKTWLAALVDELDIGALARASYCHAFLSAPGSGVPKHFDNRDVFVVQLLGRKRWRVAPPTIARPLMAHTVGDAVHAYNRAANAEALSDATMPDAVTHELVPGSVIYVPHGAWHATEAEETSLSLSFGVRVPSRVEVLVAAVSEELARDSRWQAAAFDVTRQSEETREFVQSMRAAIDDLRKR